MGEKRTESRGRGKVGGEESLDNLVSNDTIAIEEVRAQWIARARELDQNGHFRHYTAQERNRCLAKGYAGEFAPDEGLRIARIEVAQVRHWCHPRVVDQMRDRLGIAPCDKDSILWALLNEAKPIDFRPPKTLGDPPPALAFIFFSETLERTVYLKFQVKGRKKPQVLFWSCHPPDREDQSWN